MTILEREDGRTTEARPVRSTFRPGITAGAALLILLATLVPVPLRAQEPEADSTRADRPFVEGGVYDRPYLGRLLGRTAIGGYAEAHARMERVDGLTEELGFVAKRFNLFAASEISDFVRLGAEIEFEEAGEVILLEYAAIDVTLHPALTLRGGLILSPLGRFNLSHDSPLNPFTDRPLVSTELLGVALTEPGFGLLGSLPVGTAGRITYEAYATNGFHDGLIFDSPEGARLRAGRGNHEDENRSPAVVGRVTWSPGAAHEVGLSAHHGAWNVFEVDGETVDDRRMLTIAVVDVETAVAGFDLTGEAALAELDLPPSVLDVVASRQAGAYLAVERILARGLVPAMPESSVSAKLRLDAVDFDRDRPGDAVATVTLGANFRVTSDTVLKLDYVRGREWDRFNSAAETAALLLSLATYF